MGKIVSAGAVSHVLDPDDYQAACGDVGRQKADALVVVADDLVMSVPKIGTHGGR